MIFSRSSKRFLAGIATAFLLLCQTAMAAQACAVAPAAAESASSGHCHGVATQSGNESGHIEDQNCPAGYASANLAKLEILQAGDVPALEAQPRWLWAPVRSGLNAIAPPARAGPPALTIVHCCLRN